MTPRTTTSCLTATLSFGAGVLLLGVTRVQAQIPEPVMPAPASKAPAQVEVPRGVDSLSPVVQAKDASLPLSVKERAEEKRERSVALVLPQLIAGELSVEEAKRKGALNAEDALYILETKLHRWGGFGEGWDKWFALRRAVAKVAVEERPDVLSDPQLRRLPLRVRLWLGDYLGEERDERCVPVLESVLDEMKARIPIKGEEDESLSFQALERLAWFYRDTNQHQKCAETWLRWPAYQSPLDWMLADAYLEAARSREKLGPEQATEVKRLRELAIAQGNGWRSALVRHDEALALVAQGKQAEAAQAMAQSFPAKTQEAEGRVAQNAFLARFAYEAGELEETMRLSKQAVEAGEGVTFTEKPLDSLYGMAQDLYARAGGWKTQPIQADVKEIVLKTNPLQPDQPLYARFRIKTYGDTSVTATVDNPHVQVRVLSVDSWQNGTWRTKEEESEVVIQSTSRSNVKKSLISLSISHGQKQRLGVLFSIIDLIPSQF